MKIKEIIVVEGRDDTARVKMAVDADTIETNGSAIGDTVIQQVRLAQETRGVIILTDPDFPGEKIRKTIAEAVPGCKHAFCQNILRRRSGIKELVSSMLPWTVFGNVLPMSMKKWK